MAIDSEKGPVQDTARSSEPASPSTDFNDPVAEPPVVTLKTWIVSCVSVPFPHCRPKTSLMLPLRLDSLLRLWIVVLARARCGRDWDHGLRGHG
jgi:hypothetical protein